MTAKRRAGVRRRVALAAAAAMVGSLVQGTVTSSVAQADETPKVPVSEKPLSGHGVNVSPRKSDGEPRVPWQAPEHAWPKPGSATVTLSASAQGKRPVVPAGGLPISLSSPASVKKDAKAKATPFMGRATVRVLDQATAERAGVRGVLLSIEPGAGSTGDRVGVSVDYSASAQAYGGAYAARMRLVELPACAVSNPDKKGCTTRTPVAAKNDPVRQTLTANSVDLSGPDSGGESAPMLLAATAGESSESGDYKASTLSPSAAWETNLNTGDFSWSYEMPVPGVPGDLKPSLGLSYSSGAIDGRTAATNNQSSWVGDGFEIWPGFIERSYKPCADEGVKHDDGRKVGDLCWGYDNATISFNGKAGELIPAGDGVWKIKGDDGTKVERLEGTTRDNGDNDQEYWRVTTTDGTRYYFGFNKLPNWASGDETTDSTWTVPVYGNDEGEPCHASTFADAWCQQAWRWNLDYVVDRHGNAIAYYYNKETNYYARNLEPSDETSYVRGGYLDRIEYGLRSSAMYSAKALAKVDFTSAERCLPQDGVTCVEDTIDDKSFYWYDTPWDLNCKAGADCTSSPSPNFWTRKRLTGVTTQILKPDGTYGPLDSWTLDHRWGMADIDYQLLLTSVQHTGKAATSPDLAQEITLPKVTFAYDQRPNRLDKEGDDTAPFIKERLSAVSDESGGELYVNYSTPVCDWNSLPTPQSNTTRCYPSYYTAEGDAAPTLQWFNKYVVDSVTQADRMTHSPENVTRYEYLGGAAWHYDDDEGLTKEKYKTWSTWRGYGHVRVQTGGQDPVGMKSQTDHDFLRGMDGDRSGPDGGTKDVTITLGDGEGDPITDHDANAGFEYKTEQYSGPGGEVLGKTINRPWYHETARRERSWGTTTANLTGLASYRAFTSLDNGAGSQWRQTYATYTYENTAGRVTESNDLGDISTPADDKCTRTSYAENTSDWILTTVAREETVAVACDATTDRSKDVISDVRTAYDGGAYGDAPTTGDATAVATIKSHDGTTATYLEAGTTFDTYGRALTTTDLTATVTVSGSAAPVRTARSDGRTTATAYTPAAGLPTQVEVTTPPAAAADPATAQTTTTTLDPLRGLPTTVVDPNSKRTVTVYDALGRTIYIWLPNESTNANPNYQFAYHITEDKPVAVATKTLKKDSAQQTSYTIYDGLLRPRQTQDPGPDGGRLLTDTFYDERGLAAKTFAAYYNTSSPSADLLALDDALSVETQTWNSYDGLGRITESKQVAGNGDGGAVLNTTTTVYNGDRTTVTPPTGATPTTTVEDVQGRTTELWQYHGATPTGEADKTLYSYDPAGNLAKITDPAGNEWSYGYDLRGNQTKSSDPDNGSTTSVYDDHGQLASSTDASDRTVAHVYDNLGRETETKQVEEQDGVETATLLTRRTYDPTGAKGQLATAASYVGGATGDAYTITYSLYDNLYRPQRTTTTIPATEANGALAGSYQNNIRYNIDGTIQSASFPAAGALPPESLIPTYDDIQRPVTLSGTNTYVADTLYSYTGKPLQYTYGSSGKQTWATNDYEWGTQRLHNALVDRENVNGTDKSATFTYDQAGNVKAITDVSRDGTDNQCFTYDYLTRLTQAWTQNTETCSAEPAGSILGGPAPYWQSYTYDETGNRLTETLHDPTGNTAKDVKRTYTYPTPKSAQPHTLTQVDTTGPTGTSVENYTYDPTGTTHTRDIGGDTQTLTWDTSNHLTTVTQPAEDGSTETTTYIYDADGNRLLARTPTETTLYLGSMEVTLASGSTTSKATRYYDLGGGNQAIRTNDNKVSFLVGDHHGTSELAIDAADLTTQNRRSTPFGAPRGQQPTNWPGDKGFVGGTQDPTTGLTHLGARDYDPTTGRFTSPDPVLDTTNPQQINGYAYANNNPVTYSDPSGMVMVNLTHTVHFGTVQKHTSPKQATASPSKPPKSIAGFRIPPEAYEGRWPGTSTEFTWEQNLLAFADFTCNSLYRPKDAGDFCSFASAVGWLDTRGTDFILEVTGLRDVQDCIKGSVSGCIWTAVGIIPVDRLGIAAKSVVKGLKAGEEAAKAAETGVKTARSLWALTKEGSSKIMKGGPFKTTFYKSSSDGTWWTPDVTGHGQSAFKVYRETKKGLEWISDADKYGNYMPDKWKGDTGKFIPWGKLRGASR